MNDILFSIMQAVIIGGIVALLRYVVPYFTRILREHDFNFAAELVETAVRAAEQTFIGHGRGDEKFEWVVQIMKSQFNKYEIKITDDQLIQLLEAAVQAMSAEMIQVDPVQAADGVIDAAEAVPL